jgi:hypothetical protein
VEPVIKVTEIFILNVGVQYVAIFGTCDFELVTQFIQGYLGGPDKPEN